jgi:hypothetical protein
MSYMGKQGRQLIKSIKSRSILDHDVFEKWEGYFPHNF